MLNAYKIHWAVLKPAKGIPTKKDVQNGFVRFGGYLIRHAPDKEKAIESTKKLKLTKPYKMTTITDKQFSLIKNMNVEAVMTEMQKKEYITI